MSKRASTSPPRTRIIATLGPASKTRQTITAMVDAGVAAFRLNFSHGSHEEHAGMIKRVRRVGRKSGRPVSIIQDLQGTKIRSGGLKDGQPVVLSVGNRIQVTHKVALSSQGVISTTYRRLVHDVDIGDHLLLDDGHMELVCRGKSSDSLDCEVIGGGLLWAHKGINLPGVDVSAPSMTRKDRRDLEFGLAQAVDFVAISFVRSAADIRKSRRFMEARGESVPIIAKIEKPEAVNNLSEILEESDGIMVARGDLGVEIPSARLPVIQKEIIAAARERGRLVVTATQMLESMIVNRRPTRAETSDVANAILDGSDAVMLSGETAMGKYPVETIETIRDIALYTEGSDLYHRAARKIPHHPGRDIADAAVKAACTAASEIGASAVVAFSDSGKTCFKVSFARPATRMIAATFVEPTWNRLALCWGVHAIRVREARSIDDLYFLAEKNLLKKGLVDPGDLVVLLTGSNVGAGGTNAIKIHRVGVVDVTDDRRAAVRFRKLYRDLGITDVGR